MMKGFLHCVSGCCDCHRHNEKRADGQHHQQHQRQERTKFQSITSYLQVIVTKFLLEVCGAAGAVWGSSDILFLRDTPESTERVRLGAMFVGGIFLIRWWWHATHWWQHERDYLQTQLHHRRSFFQIHMSQFVLQVLGGAGAIWGCAEATTLRKPDNTHEWRIAATAIGLMFLIRWAFQILAYCLYFPALWSNPSSIHTAIRYYDAFIVKLILEVFGAVGAVWGFTEIARLRVPDTNRIWRPISLAVGAIFLLRWILHMIEMKRETPTSQMQVEDTLSQEVEDLDILSDLELKESSSTDALTALPSMEPLGLNENKSMELHTSLEVDDSFLDEETPDSPIWTTALTPLNRQRKHIHSEGNAIT